MEQQNQSDLLEDVQREINYVDPVHWSVRLANYFIDEVVALGVLVKVFRFAVAYIIDGKNYNNNILFHQDWEGLMAGLKLAIVLTFLYYTLFEVATKGRTIGKILTGTTAITQDGTPFTFKHALLRTLCRFIPFEIISGFFYMPWHDSITNTVVVKKTW
jgi:uncharacterized RDD family membrane protein YckC